MLKETTVAITIILALIQDHRCAVPIDIEELPVNKKTIGTIDLIIPQKDPIISRRQQFYKKNPDFYFYDYPLKYYDEKWVDDDYMPYLYMEPKYKTLKFQPGLPLFVAQVIPILKSMFLGTGLKQGPKDTVRVHKDDLRLWEPWRTTTMTN